MIRVTIPGVPHAQKRRGSRAVPAKGSRPAFVTHYDPRESRTWKATAQDHMARAMNGLPPLEGPVQLRVLAVFPLPASRWRKKTPRPRDWYVGSKDLSNVLKAIEDAANGVLWHDDRQVARNLNEAVVGAQGEPARVEVVVAPVRWRAEDAGPDVRRPAEP